MQGGSHDTLARMGCVIFYVFDVVLKPVLLESGRWPSASTDCTRAS